jgi:sporulation protein YlmC with PRC-barrel domain
MQQERSERMNINLGMHVYTGDDKVIGTVDKLILDPQTGTVKAAVVREGFLLHHDVEVPADMMATGPDGNAHITYTSQEVDALPRFDEADYTTPPMDYTSPFGYPLGGVYWPAGWGIGMAAPLYVPPVAAPTGPTYTGDSAVDQEISAALRREDLENAVVDKGSDVLDRDGEKVGTVQELAFDPNTNELTALVAHKGLLKGEDFEVPVSLIDKVDDGAVYLKVDARQVLL